MDLKLIKATENDKSLFWESYCQAMRSHIEAIWGWDEAWQKSDFESRWKDCENILVFEATNPVGYIQTKILADEYYIMMFIIFPEYRSKGIGHELLTRLEASTKHAFIGLRVFRTNSKALSFYTSYGFEVFSNESDFYYLKLKTSNQNTQ